ncbi:MAG: hypothetical protein MJK11_20905 [Pseudomonadales bacterium]|nr:hypothetical protein [Pseudomonadales bacterium]
MHTLAANIEAIYSRQLYYPSAGEAKGGWEAASGSDFSFDVIFTSDGFLITAWGVHKTVEDCAMTLDDKNETKDLDTVTSLCGID